MSPYTRPQAAQLARRIAEPRRFIQVVAGPRQVGKTTLVQFVLDVADQPNRYASADEPGLRGDAWIAQQWDAARLLARDAGPGAHPRVDPGGHLDDIVVAGSIHGGLDGWIRTAAHTYMQFAGRRSEDWRGIDAQGNASSASIVPIAKQVATQRRAICPVGVSL